MRIRLEFSAWEINHIVEAMEMQPQEHVDRELMEKLWAAQKRLKQRGKK